MFAVWMSRWCSLLTTPLESNGRCMEQWAGRWTKTTTRCRLPIVSKATQTPTLPFDKIMRRALMVKPDKPKKANRPKGAKKKAK